MKMMDYRGSGRGRKKWPDKGYTLKKSQFKCMNVANKRVWYSHFPPERE